VVAVALVFAPDDYQEAVGKFVNVKSTANATRRSIGDRISKHVLIGRIDNGENRVHTVWSAN
jgi:hypothetical protein